MNEEMKKVCLPEGECCAYCCGDCIYMDLNSKDRYDQAWCGKYRKYYHPSEDAGSCSYFVHK